MVIFSNNFFNSFASRFCGCDSSERSKKLRLGEGRGKWEEERRQKKKKKRKNEGGKEGEEKRRVREVAAFTDPLAQNTRLYESDGPAQEFSFESF
jgi:hypothetical protein